MNPIASAFLAALLRILHSVEGIFIKISNENMMPNDFSQRPSPGDTASTFGAAMGVDVVPEFIDEAKEAKRLLKLDKAQFEYAFLNELERDPQKYCLPYQTLLMINTYHYLYWGSRYCPTHWPDHDYLLRTLASMCTDRMLFMSPFEVSECPSDIAERAREHPDWAEQYTTSGFFDIASRYFDVSLETYLGVRPLYLMKKK